MINTSTYQNINISNVIGKLINITKNADEIKNFYYPNVQ